MSHTRRSLLAVSAAVSTAGALAVCAVPAASAHTPAPHAWASSGLHLRAQSTTSAHPASGVVLTNDVYAPFHLADANGTLLVADGGTSTVSALNGTTLTTIATGPQPGEVAGVGTAANGNWAWTSSNYKNGLTGSTIVEPGVRRIHTNLKSFEKTVNPDQNVQYGVVGHVSACVRKALHDAGAPVQYTGVVDSHPYDIASMGNGDWVVADAAGNDLIKIDAKGKPSTLAVLPVQPVTIDANFAGALGLPDCVIGVTYNFEPVPTSVQMHAGSLWVTTLAGGPEVPGLPPYGSVYKVDPATGATTQVATGFDEATDLAIAPNGTMYVASLGAGSITKIKDGKVSTFRKLPNALSVEVIGNYLYAGTLAPTDDQGNPTGPGSIVRFNR